MNKRKVVCVHVRGLVVASWLVCCGVCEWRCCVLVCVWRDCAILVERHRLLSREKKNISVHPTPLHRCFGFTYRSQTRHTPHRHVTGAPLSRLLFSPQSNAAIIVPTSPPRLSQSFTFSQHRNDIYAADGQRARTLPLLGRQTQLRPIVQQRIRCRLSSHPTPRGHAHYTRRVISLSLISLSSLSHSLGGHQ